MMMIALRNTAQQSRACQWAFRGFNYKRIGFAKSLKSKILFSLLKLVRNLFQSLIYLFQINYIII
jgi:hypothetical protein